MFVRVNGREGFWFTQQPIGNQVVAYRFDRPEWIATPGSKVSYPKYEIFPEWETVRVEYVFLSGDDTGALEEAIQEARQPRRVYFDGRNYRIQSSGRVAPWNKLVKAHWSCEEFFALVSLTDKPREAAD